jgi:AcrR family transcriptional regulator
MRHMSEKRAQRPTRAKTGATRDEQAHATRERLLLAAARFFESHPASELTLPKLARLAGVTPPTAYTNFGTVDNLMRSLYEWVLPQLGTRDPLPAPARLHEVPRERFPRFAKHQGLLRAIWTSASWSGHRSRTRTRYVETALENLRGVAPDLDDRALLVALGPIMAFAYPPMWQWLRDVLGMSEEEAEQAAVWATRSLVAALESAPPANGAEKSGAPRRVKVRATRTRTKKV